VADQEEACGGAHGRGIARRRGGGHGGARWFGAGGVSDSDKGVGLGWGGVGFGQMPRPGRGQGRGADAGRGRPCQRALRT
jgi:hypothetical protein